MSERFVSAGCKISSDGTKITRIKKGWDYKSAFGAVIIDPHKTSTHIWSFTISKKSPSAMIYIGIVNSDGDKNINANFVDNEQNEAYYALGSDGKSSEGKKKGFNEPFLKGYNKGDIVYMKLTVDKYVMKLHFKLNEQATWKPVAATIPKTYSFNMAVSLSGDGYIDNEQTQIKLATYNTWSDKQQNNTANDEEKKDDYHIIPPPPRAQRISTPSTVPPPPSAVPPPPKALGGLHKMVEDLQNEMLNKIETIETYKTKTKDLELKAEAFTNQIAALEKDAKSSSDALLTKLDVITDLEAKLETFEQNDRDHKNKISALEKELNALKNEEQKEEEVRQNQMDKKIKEDLKFLEKKLSEFNTIYDKNNILNLYNESLDSLLVNEEIDALDLRLRSFAKYLMDIKGYITSLINPDVSKYKEWNIDKMIQWIGSLENGRYRQYLDVLKSGFIEDGIDSGDCLPDLDKKDLRNVPFNISSFKDRRDLSNHFMSLKSQQVPNRYIANDEGTSTAYI